MENFTLIITHLSLVVGTLGIVVIILGAVRAGFMFLAQGFTRLKDPRAAEFANIRLVLGGHIILGLDFLVAKDIMDTMLLEPGDEIWKELAILGTVVAVRIVLTHFMLKEMRELSSEQKVGF